MPSVKLSDRYAMENSKGRHLIFKEKFGEKTTGFFWVENLINTISQNYIYIYIPYFVRIFSIESRLFIQDTSVCKHIYARLCSRDTIHSLRVPSRTRSNRSILIVLRISLPSLPFPSSRDMHPSRSDFSLSRIFRGLSNTFENKISTFHHSRAEI